MEFLNVFASVDKDQDLVIHESDLDSYAAEMKYEKAFTQKWLRLFDLDKDGKITFSEFCETLGLDEKIYEEKLREVRKNIAARQQQQQSADAERANRRISRLPRQQALATVQKPPEQEVKENVEPQLARKTQIPQRVQPHQEQKTGDTGDIDEEMVKPQAVQKIRSGMKSDDDKKASPEDVAIEFDDDDPRSMQVEFSDMEPKDLEQVKQLLAKLVSESRKTTEAPSEFDRRTMHELDKQLGKSWRCQMNPELSYKQVNYQEGSMAVLVAKPQTRLMVWQPQQSGGMCCCC